MGIQEFQDMLFPGNDTYVGVLYNTDLRFTLLDGDSGNIGTDSRLLISAAGFAGIFWCIFLPKLSDNFGRKPILAISYIAAILVPLSMWLIPGATVSMVLYAAFSSIPGAVGIFWINLIPMESLPPYLTSTGISIPMSMGEFIGELS